MKSKKKVERKRVWRAWAVVVEGELSWTDREACIYPDEQTAFKERGSWKVIPVEIRELSGSKGRGKQA